MERTLSPRFGYASPPALPGLAAGTGGPPPSLDWASRCEEAERQREEAERQLKAVRRELYLKQRQLDEAHAQLAARGDGAADGVPRQGRAAREPSSLLAACRAARGEAS
uniref:Uncharacterized protein n=1 Tax=Pyrodinium bahamense TaxID=73915 RepID=A0A7S0FK49_9DINO|mmetsp:Transcript_35684/g.98887  ORF Transcript_35684/g.98887 Transcript_35684/m.98887 type:complete len:109 (+) Transcript_35684:241-567(+)